MPFLTYKINNKIFDDYESFNTKTFNRFLYDIDDLNCFNKAIFVDNKKNSVLKKIEDVQDLVSKNTINSNALHAFNVLLTDAYRILGLSNKIEDSNEIKIDFIKDNKNEIEKIVKKKIIKGQYNYKDFDGSSENLRKDFLDKIKYYINSQNKEEKKINEIYIFHKELSKMLLPIVKSEKRTVYEVDNKTQRKYKLYKDQTNLNHNFQEYLDIYNLCSNENIRSVHNYIKNLKIIQNSMNLILSWWLSFPEKTIPHKINIISDVPECLYGESDENITKAENLINNFLFKTIIEAQIKNIEPKFKFLNRNEFQKIPELKDSEEIWTHKRHFIFGTNQNFVFSSHFGVEILTDKNSKEIRQKTVLEVEDDEKDSHLFHLKYIIPYLEKKTQNEVQSMLEEEEQMQWEAYNK